VYLSLSVYKLQRTTCSMHPTKSGRAWFF